MLILGATTGVPTAAQPRLLVDLEQEPHHYSWSGRAVELSDSLLLVSESIPSMLWRVPKSSTGVPQATFLLESVGRWWIGERIILGGIDPVSRRYSIWAIESGQPIQVVEDMGIQALPVGGAGTEAGAEESLVFVGADGDQTSGLWRYEFASGELVHLLEFSFISWDPFLVPSCDEMVRLGEVLVFCTADGLWATDGTLPGTYPLTDSGDEAIGLRGIGKGFAAFERRGKRDVWVTDGSPQGTRVLAGVDSPWITYNWVVGDDAVAWQGSHASGSLWYSDLQFNQPVKTGDPAEPWFFSQHGLVARRGNNVDPDPLEIGSEPWLRDTNGGWRLLADLATGPASSTVWGFLESGGELIFGASTPAEGAELWTSDGSPEGTEILLDLAPGPADGVVPWAPPLRLADGSLLVARQTPNQGPGVPALLTPSTGIVESLPALSLGTTSSQPRMIGTFEDSAWFQATSGGVRQVWSSQGSAASTRPVVGAGSLANCPTYAIVRISETLVSSCDGTVLRVVNSAEAVQVGRFSSAAAFRPEPPAPLGGMALSGTVSAALQTATPSPGTPARIVQLGERLVGTPPQSPGLYSLPVDGTGDGEILLPHTASGRLVTLGNLGIFGYDDGGPQGAEPWVTDGTPSGTHQIEPEIIPGSRPVLDAVLRVGSFALLAEYEGETWRTSGTLGSTSLLPGLLTRFGIHGGEVLGCVAGSLDGVGNLVSVSAAGTTFAHPDVPWITGWIGATADHTYFTTGYNHTQITLWRTDCTLKGTYPIVQLPQWLEPLVTDEQVWVRDARIHTPRQLGRMDVASGTVDWVAEWPTVPGIPGTLEHGFLVANNHIFFAAAETTTGLELWTVEADYLFGDGFESGDVSAWSGAGP